MLKKETIKELKEKLQTEHDLHVSNANAAKGAIQICDHLLGLPDEEAPKCTAEDCPTQD